jgi:hypothetical protein
MPGTVVAEATGCSLEDVTVLAGHSTLRRSSVGLGGDHKNLAVRDAIRIPGNCGGHPWPAPPP